MNSYKWQKIYLVIYNRLDISHNLMNFTDILFCLKNIVALKTDIIVPAAQDKG